MSIPPVPGSLIKAGSLSSRHLPADQTSLQVVEMKDHLQSGSGQGEKQRGAWTIRSWIDGKSLFINWKRSFIFFNRLPDKKLTGAIEVPVTVTAALPDDPKAQG